MKKTSKMNSQTKPDPEMPDLGFMQYFEISLSENELETLYLALDTASKQYKDVIGLLKKFSTLKKAIHLQLMTYKKKDPDPVPEHQEKKPQPAERMKNHYYSEKFNVESPV